MVKTDEVVIVQGEECVFYHVVVDLSLLYDKIEELRNRLGLVSLDGCLQRLPTLEVPLRFHHEFAGMELS